MQDAWYVLYVQLMLAITSLVYYLLYTLAQRQAFEVEFWDPLTLI